MNHTEVRINVLAFGWQVIVRQPFKLYVSVRYANQFFLVKRNGIFSVDENEISQILPVPASFIIE